jgi:DNA-binding CsgD family transcriptional regulator
MALLSGEAGIGKSRLVAAIKAQAEEAGFLILQGRCFETDQTLPYAPLLDLMRGLETTPAASVFALLHGALARLLTKFDATDRQEAEVEKWRRFQALDQAFWSLPRPLLLVIEDLHWGDDLSLDYLLHLARHLGPHAVCLLATYRQDEAPPSLGRWLATLDRERLAHELPLEPLTQDEVEAMIRAIFAQSEPVRREFVEAVARLSEGNPFFIEEILKSLVAAGDIFYRNGAWSRKTLQELSIPRTVQDAVQRRTQGLSQPAHRLLTLAAVAGRRFDFHLLHLFTQRPEDELVGLIKELVAAQLLVEASADRFAFRHELTRQAIYQSLLVRERRRLHRQVAETLATEHSVYRADLAHHYYAAEVWDQALHWSLIAAHEAARLYAHKEALEHYARAYQCAEKVGSAAQLAQIDQWMGDAHAGRDHFSQAADHYQRALAATPGTQSRALLKAKLGIAYGEIGDSRGLPYLQAALAELDPATYPNELARVTAMLGRYHWYQAQYAEAIAWYERAYSLAAPLDHAPTLTKIYETLAYAQSWLLRFEAGITWARTSIDYGKRHAYPPALLAGYGAEAQCASFAGDWPGALNAISHLQAIADQHDNAVSSGWGEWLRGITLQQQGNLAESAAALKRALAVAETMNESRMAFSAQINLAMNALDQGAEDVAFATAHACLAAADSSGEMVLRVSARGILAYLYLHCGEFAPALAQYRECQALLANDALPVLLLNMEARQAECSLALGRLDEASIICERQLARAAASLHHLGIAQRVWGQVQAAAKNLPVAASAFAEAITSLEATGSRLELALTYFARGHFHEAQGERSRAQQDWQCTVELAQSMGARPLLWQAHAALGRLALAQKQKETAQHHLDRARQVVDALAATFQDDTRCRLLKQRAAQQIPHLRPPTPRQRAKQAAGGLTRREYEIAQLIAQGQTSRQIADKLVLSERTVEGHVGNILTKLGFTNRAQIAVWVVETGH